MTSRQRGPFTTHRIPVPSTLNHPYVALMIAGTVCYTLIEYVIAIEVLPVTAAVTAMEIALTVGLYWRPSVCGILLVTVSACSKLIPFVGFPSQLFGIWLSVGLLAYLHKAPTSFVLIIVELLSHCYELFSDAGTTWTPSGVLSATCTYVIAAVIGLAIAEHQHAEHARREAMEQHRLREDHDRMQRNIMLASTLHDSTARGLTLITLLSDQCLDGINDSSAVAGPLRTIRYTAQTTLAQVREVIDLLDGTSDAPASGITVNDSSGSDSLADMLSATLRNNDQRMRAAGCIGISTVEDRQQERNDHPSPAHYHEITALLNEIYTNILVHANADEGYQIHLVINDHTIELSQFNNSKSERTSYHTGKGLALHRNRIRALGGNLSYADEDGMWVLAATIPYHAQD